MKKSTKKISQSPLKSQTETRGRSASKGEEKKTKKKKQNKSTSPSPEERLKKLDKDERALKKFKTKKFDEEEKTSTIKNKKPPTIDKREKSEKKTKKSSVEKEKKTQNKQSEESGKKQKQSSIKELRQLLKARDDMENRLLNFDENQSVPTEFKRQVSAIKDIDFNYGSSKNMKSHSRAESTYTPPIQPFSQRHIENMIQPRSNNRIIDDIQIPECDDRMEETNSIGDKSSTNGIPIIDNNDAYLQTRKNPSLNSPKIKFEDFQRENELKFETKTDYQQKEILLDDSNANVTKLYDQIQNLQNLNTDLKKKIVRYQRQVELIPHLKSELTSMKTTIELLQKGVVEKRGPTGDCSFGGAAKNLTNAQLELIKKQIDPKDEKNFAVLKENIDLRGEISELKEQVIKKNHIIEGMTSDFKILVNDMKYLHQKLNHGEQIKDIKESEITSKYLVSTIDNLIDQKNSLIKESNEQRRIQEERIAVLKEQISTMQAHLDRNQELILQQSGKIQSSEDMNRNLRNELTLKQDSDKMLDHFKSHTKNHLLNLHHQIDAIQTDFGLSPSVTRQMHSNTDRILQESNIDQLFESLMEKVKGSCLNEKNLKIRVDQLQVEILQKAREMTALKREEDEKRGAIIRLEEENRIKMQEHIRRIEDQLYQTEYNQNFTQQDAEAKIRNKEIQFEQMKNEIEILESFINDAFEKFQELNFQKTYLEVESRSALKILSKIENELKYHIPARAHYSKNTKLSRIFRKSVKAIIFALRIRKASSYSGTEQSLRKRALANLLDNWLNQRSYWDSSVKQNHRLHHFTEGLLPRLFRKQTKQYTSVPLRLNNEAQLQFLDAVKVRLQELEHKNMNAYSQQTSSLRCQYPETQRGRILTYEEDQRIRSLSNERGNMPLFSQTQRRVSESDNDELATRLRGVIREMETKLEEQEITYEQKIRYLKQEIEMKRLQIENMKSMMDLQEPISRDRISNNTIQQSRNPVHSCPIRSSANQNFSTLQPLQRLN